MTQRILPPNDAEMKWIQANCALGTKLIQTFASSPSEMSPSLSTLDTAFAAWLAQHDPAQEDPNPIINAFGIVFGQFFVTELSFVRAVVQDRQGTEMAVHGSPGDILVFPPNLVAKRYASRQTGFFAPTFAKMKEEIVRVRTKAVSKTPWWKFGSKRT